jgi:hypothetical protein
MLCLDGRSGITSIAYIILFNSAPRVDVLCAMYSDLPCAQNGRRHSLVAT